MTALPSFAKVEHCQQHGHFSANKAGCPRCHSKPKASPDSPKDEKQAVAEIVVSKSTILKGRQMNRTEARFGAELYARKIGGEIDTWVYEGVRLKWGERDGKSMHYTPDFFVNRQGEFVGGASVNWHICIEVKGAHIRDRDIVRFKGCRAEWTQFDFEMWQLKKGEWNQIL